VQILRRELAATVDQVRGVVRFHTPGAAGTAASGSTTASLLSAAVAEAEESRVTELAASIQVRHLWLPVTAHLPSRGDPSIPSSLPPPPPRPPVCIAARA